VTDRQDRDRSSSRQEEEPVVIRDKRKFDTDGNLRTPHDESIDVKLPPPPFGPPDEAHKPNPAQISDDHANAIAEALDLQTQLVDRTSDLQRLTAEYANYRKRVERDRFVSADNATGKVLEALLPVLDDIERAAQHGDLTGAFKAVADKFIGVVGGLGLTPFGIPGDPFDPEQHEAVMHDESDEVSEPTASTVMRSGYRLGEKLLRPAMVGVTAPSAAASSAAASAAPSEADIVIDVDPDEQS